jgi:hypothetical protein
MTEERTPIDIATDLLVYAPIGLAIHLGKMLPELVETGRSRAEIPVTMTRAMCKAMLAQQRHTPGGAKLNDFVRVAEMMVKPFVDNARNMTTPSGSGAGAGASSGTDTRAERATKSGSGSEQRTPPRKSEAGTRTAPRRSRTPDVESLAVPGYSSLSASQVVSSLRGLSREELQAIRTYESSTRARRTVLDRIETLLANAS